jgi:hypothetical protein
MSEGLQDARESQQLSEQQLEQQFENILSDLYAEPPSPALQEKFARWMKGVPISEWSRDSESFRDKYIEGLLDFAELSGPERDKYFPNELNGMHNPISMQKTWNEKHPQHLITEEWMTYQCPPDWSCVVQEGCWVLIYMEDDWPRGLNNLIKGLVVMDCGMAEQVRHWNAIRYVIGDELSRASFKFRPGEFILTQDWAGRLNRTRTLGNLLSDFYYYPETMELETCIRSRFVFNYPLYTGKHPAGVWRLENVTRIPDGRNLTFNPSTPQNIFSDKDLHRRLRQAYDAPQDAADFNRLEFYKENPAKVPGALPNYTWRSAEVMAEDARRLANHVLSDAEWEDSRLERERKAARFDRPLDIPLLFSCLKEAHHSYVHGATDMDVLFVARRARDLAWAKLVSAQRKHADSWRTKLC